MTTARKLWLGFGTLTILLMLSGVAIIERVLSIEARIAEMATVAEPRATEARLLEIKVLGYALAVRAHAQGVGRARQDALEDAADVDLHLKEYERLATTDRQRVMVVQFAQSWQALKGLGHALLAIDKPVMGSEESAKFYVLRSGLEKLLGEEMQVEAAATYDARRKAALGDARTIVTLSLILLFAGLVIAAVTGIVVGRGIVKAERQVLAERELLRVTLASIGDAVITADTQGRVAFLNAVAQSLTGWTQSDAEGQPLETVFRVVNERTRETIENAAATSLREGAIVGMANHTVLIARDGSERAIDDSAAPIRDAEGRIAGCVFIFRDVTVRNRAETALRDSEQRLRQLTADLSETDRRKTEFLALLSHELRNPLAPIRNALQIMRMKGTDGAVSSMAVAMMNRQLGQMERLVDELLDVSRISRGTIELRREPVELADVVAQAVEASRVACEKMGHDLVISLPSEPMVLHADAIRLVQVIGNLINNACKFTNPGGRVRLGVEREGDVAVIRVQDNGIGIDAAQRSRVFDMFMQVDTSLERSASGLGIGLTLVKSLVEKHGGSVEVHSAGAGQGSEFVVRLPIMVAAAIPKAPVRIVEEPTPASALRILIVDDNRDSAASLATLLALIGNEPRTAHDGLEAVEAAASFRPDVILLDIGLPKLNGFEACRRIRKEPWSRGMLIVALTGWGQEEDRERSKDAGFDAHLVKPVDLATLMKLLSTRAASARLAGNADSPPAHGLTA